MNIYMPGKDPVTKGNFFGRPSHLYYPLKAYPPRCIIFNNFAFLILDFMRGYILWTWSLLFTFAVFNSCAPPPVEKKESLAVVINFFSPDTSYYPAVKNFPFPDFVEMAPSFS